MTALLKNCRICPRNCGADRTKGEQGICKTGNTVYVARAGLHPWEEPCISGKNGSGTVFFSGCNLRCVFCQNAQISRSQTGVPLTVKELCHTFFRLEEQGAHNINLVTATHFFPLVLAAVKTAKQTGITLPFVYNCGGYESAETLKQAEGIIDIYLPDVKYMSQTLAKNYSDAPNYPETAKSAIAEMVRQQPKCVFHENGTLQKGVLVRHLLLPQGVLNGKAVLKYLYQTYGDSIYISIMNQYTPPETPLADFPWLNRNVFPREYEELVCYAKKLGIKNAFIQTENAAGKEYIPDFSDQGRNGKDRSISL